MLYLFSLLLLLFFIAFHCSYDWLVVDMVVGLLNPLLEYGYTEVDHMWSGGKFCSSV